MPRHWISHLLLFTAVAVMLVAASPASVFAHARYDRSEPMAGGTAGGDPFVLQAWFTQELMLRSWIMVMDETGAPVDHGDGRVDPDDPNRKLMLVSLPALPVGVYTVHYLAASAEDGHDEEGSFTFGVGMMPPAAGTTTPTTDILSASLAGRPSYTCRE